MKRKIWTAIPAALALLILILDTKTALLGASDGLALCISTVIPSLFPFFVLSILLTSMLSGKNIPILRPLGQLCGVVNGAESLLLVGMLGGYPTGAQCVAQSYRDGGLTRLQSQRMLAFCNLAGPAFLFGIIGSKFSSSWSPWLMWGIHIVSALLVALLLPGRTTAQTNLQAGKPLTFSEALHRSIGIMASVCGWIVLFRILISFLDRWILWLLPVPVQVALTGLLELSNGCSDLARISNEDLRFVICAGMLAFGGVCVTMQTCTVTKGLSLSTYFLGKLLQVLISIFLAALLRAGSLQIPLFFWILIPGLIAIIVKFLHKKQKKCSISQPVGV